ncbi:MAG: hypothetical protein A2219_01655 [Elusimicrobia bacterium RIFOXYA2_FULL_50_26]|nr:MAG: hypothetical protein A2219_01655 [Elusimicrobia bacterium RIFOXYA2_FULL_50_26]
MNIVRFTAILFLLCVASLLRCDVASAELKILTVTPLGATDARDASNTIAVTFDKPIVPLEQLPEGDGAGPLIIKPAIKGQYRWQGTSTLSFTPSEPLAAATEYEVTIPGKLKSQITGDVLKDNYSWRFETVRPKLVYSSPRDGEGWVSLDESIILFFNLPMDPRKVRPGGAGKPAIRIFELDSNGKKSDADYNIVRNAVAKDFENRRIYIPEKLSNTLILFPTRPLNKGCTYIIDIEQGLLAREGNLGTLKPQAIRFKAFADFAYISPVEGERVTPGYGLNLKFSNPVRNSDLIKHFRIDPEIEINDDYYGHDEFSSCSYNAFENDVFCWSNIPVKLKAGTTCQIMIDGALEDKYGQKLGKDITVNIRVDDFPSRMDMPTGVGIVEKYLPKLRHPITLLNIEELRLQKAMIPPESIVPFARECYDKSYCSFSPVSGFNVDRMWYPKINRNERTLLPIELKESLGDSLNGMVYLQVSHEDEFYPKNYRYQNALLQVTGLGITGKFSPDGNLIYVSYLKTAMPVKEADIELRDDSNKVLWRGKTNGFGFAATPGWEDLNIVPAERWKKPRLWVVARKNGDLSFIHSDWGTGIYPYHFNIDYDWSPACPVYQGYIFSERGIYRPGEPVYIKGILREKRQGRWQIPRIKDYKIFIKDSRSTEVLRSTITVSGNGSFDFVYTIDKNSPTGYYSIYVWQIDAPENTKNGNDGGYSSYNDRNIRLSSSFRVEEYKPAIFEVTTRNDREEYITGDTVTVKVNGRYLTGSAMADAEINYSARLVPGGFAPEGCDGYTFGTYDWNGGEYSHGDRTIVSGSDKLDREGVFTFSYMLKPGGGHGSYNVISEASVTAPDRQKLSGRAVTTVHGAEFYIGLKSESTFIEKGSSFKTNVVAVNSKGRRISGKLLECSLVRREWRSVRVGGTGRRWEWQTEVKDVMVTTFTIVSNQAPYAWSYQPDKSGYYYLRVNATDDRGNAASSSQYFYVTGQDYCGWQREDTDRIELVCDKVRYKPGETAKILVKSPYEYANAVITLEREGIITQWLTTVKGSADTIVVPIKKDYLPNVYVCVMLYQGRTSENKFSEEEDENGDKQDLGKPSFKIGYTNLPVDADEKRLTVNVATDKKEYRPGQQVNVSLKVADNRNKGTPCEVDVAVSDLGILNLINYATPNPFPYFYGSRPLSVETAETRLHMIGQRNYGEKGENRGGGGGFIADVDPRSKFIPTAYWNPKIIIDSGGNARFSFILPGNLSSFRVMATAHTKDSSFGCGDTRFAVNKPLMLKPSLPRFVMPGDKFSAGVLCHNNTQADGNVLIQVEATGIVLEGGNSREVEVKRGEVKEVVFNFVAKKPGNAEFVFKAALGQETDGLQWTVPVNMPRQTEAVATYGSTIDSAKEAVKIPSNICDEASSLNLAISPTALVGVKGGLEYLFEYPYGCLEQKTSKVLPLILAGKFIDTFNLAPLKEHGGAEIINSYIKEAVEFQHSSGGFRFWKGGNGVASPYLTCYVAWVLSQAKDRGYAVNPDVIAKACNYLKAYLRDDKSVWAWPYGANAGLTTKAFCVYVLSLNGYHEQSYINDLYSRREQMSLLGKIYLLKAIHYEKMNQALVDTIVQELSNRAKYSPTEIHFEEHFTDGMEWIWNSNVRTTAAILQGILEVKGEFPNAEKVAKWLASQRKSGRWTNTQDNTYVFYAFNEYVNRYEKENPDFTAIVTLEGKDVLNEVFKGRTLNSTAIKIPVSGYSRDVLLPVDFRKTGAGRLYYDLRMIYSPLGELKARNEGIYVEKKIETFKGGIDGNKYQLSGRYKVTLKVKSDQDRRFVVVDDPLPAGFEIVDMSFATESSEEARQFSQTLQDDGSSWWGGFDYSEKYDDRVLLFANYLEHGEHTYTYLMQATTAGEFFMPPTKAEEMYTPEVFGRTSQGTVIIK